MTGLPGGVWGPLFGGDDDVVSRRNVRHALIRAHNRRISELRDDRWPLVLRCSAATFDELAMDGDPAEAQTLDALGRRFLGIPLEVDQQLGAGEFAIDWPPSPQVPAGAVEQPRLFETPVAGRADS